MMSGLSRWSPTLAEHQSRCGMFCSRYPGLTLDSTHQNLHREVQGSVSYQSTKSNSLIPPHPPPLPGPSCLSCSENARSNSQRKALAS